MDDTCTVDRCMHCRNAAVSAVARFVRVPIMLMLIQLKPALRLHPIFSKTVNPGALLIGWFERSRREEAIPHVCAAPRLRMVSVVQREHFG